MKNIFKQNCVYVVSFRVIFPSHSLFHWIWYYIRAYMEVWFVSSALRPGMKTPALIRRYFQKLSLLSKLCFCFSSEKGMNTPSKYKSSILRIPFISQSFQWTVLFPIRTAGLCHIEAYGCLKCDTPHILCTALGSKSNPFHY